MRTFLLCGVIVLICLWLHDAYDNQQQKAKASSAELDFIHMAWTEQQPAFIDFDWQYQRLPLGTCYHCLLYTSPSPRD